eukprot:COSAG02_NODE_42051_length_388_cov_0.896194_1_plen_77_part_10
MMVALRLGALATLAGLVRGQTGFCTGNDDAGAEPDVACGRGYALSADADTVLRGDGNAPTSAEALAACCERVFCAQA